MPALSLDALATLPDSVDRPTYLDRAPKIGIAHIGVGNFHRSHQAMYIDRLLTADPDAPWAICGVGVREEDRGLFDALRAQDGLYSLSLFEPDGSATTRVIGSLREFVLAPDDPAAAVARLADPDIRIVSMTITESGYVEDPENGRTAGDDPVVRADAESDFAAPRSAFGLIVAALRARRDAGVPPFTVESCDNVQNNGVVARRSVVATARLAGDEFADWIDQNVSFPSTMVDRITPRANPGQLEVVARNLGGVDDAAAVVAEPFEQWVLEDDFSLGRPDVDTCGAVFVDEIDTFEFMKLRLLNASHQVLAHAGLLRGHTYAHEAMADPEVVAQVDRYWNELALPTTRLPEGVDGAEYVAVLHERYGNPAIADTLERIATDPDDRMSKFVMPVFRDAQGTIDSFVDVASRILANYAVAIAETDSAVVLANVPDDALAALRDASDPAGFLSRIGWLAPVAQNAQLRDAVAERVSALRAR